MLFPANDRVQHWLVTTGITIKQHFCGREIQTPGEWYKKGRPIDQNSSAQRY